MPPCHDAELIRRRRRCFLLGFLSLLRHAAAVFLRYFDYADAADADITLARLKNTPLSGTATNSVDVIIFAASCRFFAMLRCACRVTTLDIRCRCRMLLLIYATISRCRRHYFANAGCFHCCRYAADAAAFATPCRFICFRCFFAPLMLALRAFAFAILPLFRCHYCYYFHYLMPFRHFR